ncbi:IS701 family transposase [Streptomyces sp. NPDC052236]|uniref:IS701 family transposase n=1 Tax=Streptomyces sp. NPDC052236 TaxID=3365686 RepID=UPI0037D7B470
MASTTRNHGHVQRGLRHKEAGAARAGHDGVRSAELRRRFRRLENLFNRTEPRDQAFRYVCDLLALPAQKCTEDGRNRLLTTARWDEDLVRDRIRDMVVENLSSPDAALVITEEGFVKNGHKSAGVERQYCASAERVDNYQIGLFLLYAGKSGSVTAIDRELLLPPSWAGDALRRAASKIPADIRARDREDLVLAMIDRALAAHVPAGWVVADTPWYGDSARLRTALEARRIPYVLACSAAAGSLTAVRGEEVEGFVRWRRPRPGGGCHLAFARGGTRQEELMEAARKGATRRHYIDSARREAGKDRYAARHWRAWYRHMSLVMFAHAHLTLSRARPDLAGTGRQGLAGPGPCGAGRVARGGDHWLSPAVAQIHPARDAA